MSSYLIKNKKDYYRLLNEVRTKENWEEWVIYMLEGIESTSKNSILLIDEIKKIIQETKIAMRDNLPKIYSKDLLELLFVHPYTKIAFLVEELGITRKTASSYLKALEKVGILESIKMGREIYFVNSELFKLLQKS